MRNIVRCTYGSGCSFVLRALHIQTLFKIHPNEPQHTKWNRRPVSISIKIVIHFRLVFSSLKRNRTEAQHWPAFVWMAFGKCICGSRCWFNYQISGIRICNLRIQRQAHCLAVWYFTEIHAGVYSKKGFSVRAVRNRNEWLMRMENPAGGRLDFLLHRVSEWFDHRHHKR